VIEVLGYLLSILIGVVLGMLGGGGSILAIPILVYLFHVPPTLAGAYSLFIVGVTSLVGAIPKYREQLVNLRTGLLFGIPSIVSIFFTRYLIIPAIPDLLFNVGSWTATKRELQLGLLAILMVLASLQLIRGRKEVNSDKEKFRIPLLVIEGILIGFLTGLVGAGGGFLIIPALVFLTGLPFKTVVGTSLVIIAINSLIGFLGDVITQTMNWEFLLAISSLAIVGIFIGHYFSRKVAALYLRKLFGWFTLAVGISMIIREFFR
jgi:hypothetical protein